MKKYWNKLALAAAAAIMAACAPTYPEPTASGLPQASNLDVTIQVDQETNYVTFTMNNKGVVPIWIFGEQKIDGKASKKYSYTQNGVSLRFREAGEYAVEVKAYNPDGIAWYYEFVPEGSGGDEPEPEVEPLDPTRYDVEGDTNLWKSATLEVETWYSPGDWSGGLTPDYEITAGNGITVTIPEGVGGSEWMGQTKLKSHIASSADKEYDLSVTLLADEDMTVTIKLTNDPEGADDVNSFFYDGKVQLTAGEPLVYRRHNLKQSVSGDNVMLIFDFGRSPVGSVIEASEIIFMEE